MIEELITYPYPNPNPCLMPVCPHSNVQLPFPFRIAKAKVEKRRTHRKSQAPSSQYSDAGSIGISMLNHIDIPTYIPCYHLAPWAALHPTPSIPAPSYILHIPRRLILVSIIRLIAPHAAHIVIALALLARLVRRVLARVLEHVLLHLGLVALRLAHHERGRLAVQRVGGVRVAQELREEDFENVDHVVHGRPGLVDDVEAHGAGSVVRAEEYQLCSWSVLGRVCGVSAQVPKSQRTSRREEEREMDVHLIDVRMEYPVHKPNARTLIGVLVGQLDVYLPQATGEGRLVRAFKPHVELLHIVVDECDFVVAHEPAFRTLY